jgi:hypothetical protein
MNIRSQPSDFCIPDIRAVEKRTQEQQCQDREDSVQMWAVSQTPQGLFIKFLFHRFAYLKSSFRRILRVNALLSIFPPVPLAGSLTSSTNESPDLSFS